MDSITTWNNYIKLKANFLRLDRVPATIPSEGVIAYGSGLSYGDAPLSKNIVRTETWKGISSFNTETGILTCKSGTTLSEIIEHVLPLGWFLKVTPGTKNITVGGAVAADVHGKNHCTSGSFSHHVLSMVIQTGNNNLVHCSPEVDPELFWFSFGGMGLTGILIEVTLQLGKADSKMLDVSNTQIFSFRKLTDQFEASKAKYKIAWIKNGKSSSFQSVFTAADDNADANLKLPIEKKPLRLFTPLPLVNSASVWFYNKYRWSKTKEHEQVHLLNFLYPLDALANWNHAYGKNGFLQYQCAIPMPAKARIEEILELSFAKAYPFLTVLKQLGKGQDKSPLSFPLEGYTLAMDFRITDGLFDLFELLDQIVIESGGRVYLAKDCRLRAENFRQMYPQWNTFQEFISRNMNGQYHSRLSERLQLTQRR